MLKCKNDSSKKYKGTEPSPKGLGFCAHTMKRGSKMRGNDGNEWIVKKTSKDIKRWVINNCMSSKEASKWIKKNILIDDLKKKMEKEGVKVFLEKNFGNNYGIDYYWDGVREKLGSKYLEYKFLIIICDFTLNKPKVLIQHNGITRSTKKKVIKIFINIFGKKFVWNGNQTKVMEIIV